ncbi:hypothetical protein, partial [Bartonella sp. AC326YNZD]|uniref:hypothetical protein n=1 Tax=Bartonella sp. AC326YNZD TaxID=3243451 RepID=UPI0035CF6F68
MTVLGETIHFKVFDFLPLPSMSTIDDCAFIDCLDSLISENYLHDRLEDKLEVALVNKRKEDIFEEETKCYHELLDNAPIVSQQKESSKPLDLPISLPEEEMTPPKLELKELPKHLKYVFLGERETYPVIISSTLTQTQEE